MVYILTKCNNPCCVLRVILTIMFSATDVSIVSLRLCWKNVSPLVFNLKSLRSYRNRNSTWNSRSSSTEFNAIKNTIWAIFEFMGKTMKRFGDHFKNLNTVKNSIDKGDETTRTGELTLISLQLIKFTSEQNLGYKLYCKWRIYAY